MNTKAECCGVKSSSVNARSRRTKRSSELLMTEDVRYHTIFFPMGKYHIKMSKKLSIAGCCS